MSRSSCISPIKSSVGVARRLRLDPGRPLPQLLLRLEGFAVLLAAVVLYAKADFGWILFAALFLALDVSIAAYNADLATRLALIWLGHIGVDRFLGYGLKYPTAVKDTNLGRVWLCTRARGPGAPYPAHQPSG